MKKVVSKRYGQDWELIILNGLGESQKKNKKTYQTTPQAQADGKKKKKNSFKV